MFKKRIRNKQFDYLPRFYDPIKDDLEGRLGQYKDDVDQVNRAKDSIRGGFNKKSRSSKSSIGTQARVQSNIRLAIIILVLALLSYLILKSDIFFKFAEAISG